MKKTYVLDTSVLAHDPKSLHRFEDNDVIIPIGVIEELDGLKKGSSEVSKNARDAIKELDKLRLKGSLSEGVPLEGGGTLKVELNHQNLETLPEFLKSFKTNDNRILAVVSEIKKEKGGKEGDKEMVILVSNDANLRVKADTLGIVSQDYKAGKVDLGDINSSVIESDIPIPLKRNNNGIGWCYERFHEWNFGTNSGAGKELIEVPYNTFILSPNSILKIADELKKVKPVTVWGITPRNPHQACALGLLLDDSISLVALTGIAGTGKTLLTIASALSMVIEGKRYRRILITKPVIPVGKEIGFLPGTKEDKYLPWMQSLYDTVKYLTMVEGKRNKQYTVDTLIAKGILELNPLQFVRGRSLPKQLIIVDETQNMSPHEVKTLVTRAGEGSKVVLLGDINQIDTPYLDRESNGLSHTIKKASGNKIFGHVNLVKSERSKLAGIASEIL